MLDRLPSYSRRELRAGRRAILAPAGALMLGPTALAPFAQEHFSAMQAVSMHVARTIVSSSAESVRLESRRAALGCHPARFKLALVVNFIGAAKDSATPESAALIDAAFPATAVKDEEIAVAILDMPVDAANNRFDPKGPPAVRRFPRRLRTQVVSLISTESGRLKADCLDLLTAAPVGAVSPSDFDAEGKHDLLRRMKLPRAAARITPAGTGPISRFSRTTFDRWSSNSQLYRLLDTRSLQQRRQIEFVSRTASAVLAHRRIPAATAEEMIRWGAVQKWVRLSNVNRKAA